MIDKEPMLTYDEMQRRAAAVAAQLLSGDEPEFEYRPTGHERVKVEIENMPDIPADSNPFLYDQFSMGSDLVRGWVVMHPGFDNKDRPDALQWLYLVNTRTGQRIKIGLNHQPSIEQINEQHSKWQEARQREAERKAHNLQLLAGATKIKLKDGEDLLVKSICSEQYTIEVYRQPERPDQDVWIRNYSIDNIDCMIEPEFRQLRHYEHED